MGTLQKENAALNTRMRAAQRLCFDVTITANGTPANKVHATDLAGVAFLRTQGLTAEADAIEAGTFTTAADATGIFGILVDLGDNPADKIYRVELEADTGTVALGAQGATVTAGGRLSLDLDSNQDLSSQDITVTVCIDYREDL